MRQEQTTPLCARVLRQGENMPRQRNLWVTDTVEWCRETRLAWPANPLPVVGFFRSQLPFEPV